MQTLACTHLHTLACTRAQVERAGGEVPFDALPSNLSMAAWLDDALAGAADFADNMCVCVCMCVYVFMCVCHVRTFAYRPVFYVCVNWCMRVFVCVCVSV